MIKLKFKNVGVIRKLLVQWMVAMISAMDVNDLLQYTREFVASLSRFTDEGPVASILISFMKGILLSSLDLL